VPSKEGSVKGEGLIAFGAWRSGFVVWQIEARSARER